MNGTPRPLAHVTVAEAATTALFNAIVDGTLAPGTHLRLKDLAEQFGLSMMPMREAVRRLEALGLVELEPHRGAFVRPKTLADLQSTYATRRLLEGEAAAQAAEAFTEAEASLARRALDDLDRCLAAGDTEHARDAHERFHFTIYHASASPWLVRSITPLWRNAERYRLESLRPASLAKRRAREHDAILAAVVAGDAEAARKRMDEHLCYSMDLAVLAFEEAEASAPRASNAAFPGAGRTSEVMSW